MSWQHAAAVARHTRLVENSLVGRQQTRIAELEARIAELEQQLSTKPTEIIREVPVFRRPALEAPAAFDAGFSVLTIKRVVSAYYEIELLHMESTRREWQWSRPRQVAIFLACHHTGHSLSNIGRMFGGRDHTTVLHARKAVEARMIEDKNLAADVAAIRALLAESRKADT